MQKLFQDAKNLQTDLIGYRRALHMRAEVGFELPKTKEFLENTLKEIGCDFRDCGRAGIQVMLGKGKKCVLLRADCDGLPIQEKTGLPYASKKGNMHACGHDMHTAMLLGAIRLLKKRERELPCKVKCLFQPAEEILEGAQDCIKNGILKGVSSAVSLHVMTDVALPSGTVVIPSGGVGAPAADYFKVEVYGKSCHGSAPQNGVDAVSVLCQILFALQEITAREIPVTDCSVLTVGKIKGGTAGNVIAEHAEGEGTLRSFDEETRAFIKKRIEEISAYIAKAFRAKAKVEFYGGCPTLVNDQGLSAHMYECTKKHFNADMVLSSDELGGGTSKKSGGSEDFAYFSHEVSSLLLALSAGETEKGYEYPLHHPKVCFDESVLYIGSGLYALFALSSK